MTPNRKGVDMGVRKNIYFTDEEYEKLQEIKEEYGLKNDSAAMRFLMKTGELSQNIAKNVVTEIEENYMKSQRLRYSTRTAEENSVLLLDAVNTILYAMKLNELIPVDKQESPLIKESRKRLDEKIENRKQRKKKF